MSCSTAISSSPVASTPVDDADRPELEAVDGAQRDAEVAIAPRLATLGCRAVMVGARVCDHERIRAIATPYDTRVRRTARRRTSQRPRPALLHDQAALILPNTAYHRG
jgi:hypothetical protein